MKHLIKSSLVLGLSLLSLQSFAQQAVPSNTNINQPGISQQAATQAATAGLTQQAAESQLRINTASAEEIAGALSGVGLVKAEGIVAFRDLNGPFASIDELAQVKGIGPATLEKNQAVLSFE